MHLPVRDGFHPASGAQLRKKFVYMVFYRRDGQEKTVGNRLVVAIERQQLQDLDLPFAQLRTPNPLRREVLAGKPGDPPEHFESYLGRAREFPFPSHRADADEVGNRSLYHHIRARTRLDQVRHRTSPVFIDIEEHRTSSPRAVANPPRQLPRHLRLDVKIDENEVRRLTDLRIDLTYSHAAGTDGDETRPFDRQTRAQILTRLRAVGNDDKPDEADLFVTHRG